MLVLCVDSDELCLQETLGALRGLAEVNEAVGFRLPSQALDWLSSHRADAAVLEIQTPQISGLALAEKIRERSPQTAILFLTAHGEYAVDAFALHPAGFMLKPVSQARLRSELSYARSLFHPAPEKTLSEVMAKTFGNFDLIVGGRTVVFGRSKAKELMAYLVDRRGERVTRAEAFSLLWERGVYDRAMQKQLDVIIRSLRAALEKEGIAHVVEMQGGALRVDPEAIRCDLYRFLAGDPEAIRSFRGEYMSAYSWASVTEAFLSTLAEKN